MTDNNDKRGKPMELDPMKVGMLIQKIENMHADVKEIKVDVKKQNGRVRINTLKIHGLYVGLTVVVFFIGFAFNMGWIG